MPIVITFHFSDNRNLNFEIYDLLTSESHIFKNLRLHSFTCEKTKCMIIIFIKVSTKMVKFKDPGSGSGPKERKL